MGALRVVALGMSLTLVLASCAGGGGEGEVDDQVAGPDDGDNARETTAAAPSAVKIIAEGSSQPMGEDAVLETIDYGSFQLVIVDEKAAGGREALAAKGLAVRDDLNRIFLEAFPLDTKRAAAAEALLPPAQRRDELKVAKQEDRLPKDGLYLVQLIGPVRDEWLADLKSTGLEIVSYIPENSYVVRARGAAAAAELVGLESRFTHVQYVGDFHPAYRLSSGLRDQIAGRQGGDVDVLVQVVDGPDVAADLADLRALAVSVSHEYPVLNFRNVAMTVDRARLEELAAREYVFHIEERDQKVRLDEVQGQIVAGNLSGTQPSGPGYLAWLGSKGFGSSQFSSFVVNVVDDAYTLSGHPDLVNSRIAFAHNPTDQTGALGGHGFLNAHIVGGLNTSSGAPYTDAGGYHLGLGIAPWARVGATAIFGPTETGVTATAWEQAAYALSARVSTNSWGFPNVYKYDAWSQEYDVLVRDSGTAAGNQEYTIVFAAGNSGPNGNTVSSPATAKNVISVGASENVRGGTDGCFIFGTGADSANDIISFSSRGPVNAAAGDGRIKPDIVAPGTHIEAGVPQSNYDGSSVCNKYWPSGQTLYGWSSGTSHSAPGVAGGAALVYQHFLNQGRAAPSPAMLKAFLMNSAAYMTGAGAGGNLPSNSQGMGRMDLGRGFDTTARILVDQTQTLGSTGQTYTLSGTVASAGQPLRVTLAFTDAAGPTTGAPWVNNLDLEVSIGGTTYRGNVFSGASSTSGGAADGKNNVESVFLPSASGSFTVTVRAANIAGDGVPGNADTTDQDFALVVYNGQTSTSSPAIGVSPASFSFSGTAGGANPASQTLSISNTGGGTLSYTVADSAAWLTVSPASGTAPSSVTLSVSTAGLSAGTYSGSVTVTSSGATNSPVTVPVTLTVVSATSPSIGLSPTSFSFSGTVGGANPGNQTLSVTNAGTGTLSFSVSENATWLTVSPASGTAPASVTVSASVSGLAAGTYNATITVTAAGATNSPRTVPVTLTLSGGGGSELLVNGGFEGSTSPWVLSGNVFRSTGNYPHSGTGYTILGYYNSASGQEYQTVTLPSGAAKALTFWLNVTSSETSTTIKWDNLYVEVRSTSGVLLGTLARFSNLDKQSLGTYLQRGPYNLSAWAGQTVRIQLRGTTDSSLVTSFRVDDVSVK
jgi:hypothetical protein